MRGVYDPVQPNRQLWKCQMVEELCWRGFRVQEPGHPNLLGQKSYSSNIRYIRSPNNLRCKFVDKFVERLRI